jgi:DNA-binding NarL/FixJ family response regulator
MQPYRIMLADDHVLVRKGIRKILQEQADLSVVGEAGDGLELLELLQGETPDLVILDISMPRLRGLEATKKIKELHPQVKVLILTMHRDQEYLARAMSDGADGYILKEDADLSLYSAIDMIRRGQSFISAILSS